MEPKPPFRDMGCRAVVSARSPKRSLSTILSIVDSEKLEHGRRMIYAGGPSSLGFGVEGRLVPTFWFLLRAFLDHFVREAA